MLRFWGCTFVTVRRDLLPDGTAGVCLVDQRITCGCCRDDLPNPLVDAIVVMTPTGNVIVRGDQGIHRCITVDRGDEIDALMVAGPLVRHS